MTDIKVWGQKVTGFGRAGTRTIKWLRLEHMPMLIAFIILLPGTSVGVVWSKLLSAKELMCKQADWGQCQEKHLRREVRGSFYFFIGIRCSFPFTYTFLTEAE